MENAAKHAQTRISLLHRLQDLPSQNSKNLRVIWLGISNLFKTSEGSICRDTWCDRHRGPKAENNIIMCMWACINLHKLF